MTEHKKLQPEIRFAGFTDDWEQRKLGELVNFKNGMNMDKNQMGFGYPFVNLQDVFEKSIVNDQYLGLVNSSKLQQQEYNLLKGDILLVRSSVKVEGVGLTSLIIKDIYECTYSGFLIRLRFIEKVNDNFKIFLFSTPYIRTQILSNATSSANTNINQEALKEIKINLPSLEEQTTIGNFFKQLDDTIALHQRELDKLKILKEAYLKSIFVDNSTLFCSKNAITWEQRKLGDFGVSTSGTSIESEFSDSGKYKVISIGSYSENSLYLDQGIRVNETDKTNQRILKKNDLTMILNDKTASGNIIGRVLLIDANDSYVYNQRNQRIEINKEKFVPEFLYQLLNANHIRKKIFMASQGNTQIYVNWSSIKNFSYLIPKSKEEQTAIGNFFKQLDDTIALHQKELAKYQQIKAACLEKMFIK